MTSKLQEEKFLIKNIVIHKKIGVCIFCLGIYRYRISLGFSLEIQLIVHCLGFFILQLFTSCSEEVHRSSRMTHWGKKVQRKEEAEVLHQCPTTRTALVTIITGSRVGMRKRCLHFLYKVWLCKKVRVGVWQQNVSIFFKAFFYLLLKMKLIKHRQALKWLKHSIKELIRMLILSQQIILFLTCKVLKSHLKKWSH